MADVSLPQPSPAVVVRTARWRPTPLVALSLLLVPAGIVLLSVLPRVWPWVLAAWLADHLLLTVLGLWPRSTALGANRLRLPAVAAARGEIAITIDDGPDATVTPQVLNCLDAHGARATFFYSAARAAAQPQLVAEILRRGHEIGNHSWHHSHAFSLYGPWRLRREIDTSQAMFTRLCGQPPRHFRAPAGLRNVLLDRVLWRAGLRLVTWTRRGFDTACGDPARVLARLTRGLAAGDILLLHDGNAARTAAGEPVILAVLPVLLQRCIAHGLRPVTLTAACARAAAA